MPGIMRSSHQVYRNSQRQAGARAKKKTKSTGKEREKNVKSDEELIRRVFTAALSMGYALQRRLDPSGFHQRGRPKEADPPGAEDDLRNALESIKAGQGLRGDTPDDLVKSLSHRGGPAWRREALTKVIRALALIQTRDPAADRQALDLLGRAVWEKQEAEPEAIWEREIKDVWPTRPSSADSTKA